MRVLTTVYGVYYGLLTLNTTLVHTEYLRGLREVEFIKFQVYGLKWVESVCLSDTKLSWLIENLLLTFFDNFRVQSFLCFAFLGLFTTAICGRSF